MRIISFIIFLLVINLGFITNKTKVKFTSKSEVAIKGKSNVNSFECNYNSNYLSKETIEIEFLKENTKTKVKGAIIYIKSDGFDCGNKMITKDFKTILKSDVYSYITINLKELVENKSNYTAIIDVTIAGFKKEYSLPVTFNSKNLNVKGQLKLNIKDFKLKSPKKLLGMIKVNDNVEIDFNLFLQY